MATGNGTNTATNFEGSWTQNTIPLQYLNYLQWFIAQWFI